MRDADCHAAVHGSPEQNLQVFIHHLALLMDYLVARHANSSLMLEMGTNHNLIAASGLSRTAQPILQSRPPACAWMLH